MEEREHFLWVEKYRPKRVEDCILPKELNKILLGIVSDGKIPNLILSGKSGVGKTTIAKAICDQLNVDYIFINSSDERGINLVRDTITQFASSLSLDGNHKIVILDEADNLTGDAQDALRGCIEQFSKNCGYIFTCNFSNKIKDALHSRFSHLEFKIEKGEKLDILTQEAKRLYLILDKEKIEYDKKIVIDVANKFFPDFRRTINELQKYSKSNGKIDEGILVRDAELNFVSLFKSLKTKKYQEIRQWVVENLDNDSVSLYRKFYDSLDGRMVPQSIPQAIIHIGNYLYRNSFVADAEINFLSFLTEILRDCEFI